jgi:predicted O-methyltransferase YrrM
MTDALTTISAPGYAFTRTWFRKNAPAWSKVFENHRPAAVLEIGSFEGYSACWAIAQAQVIGAQAFELHCIDTWEGGIEHQIGSKEAVEMAAVERRFTANIVKARRDSAIPRLDVHVHKGLSHLALGDLIAQRKLGHFDLIYVDGSHQAPDVLSDAVMCFPLLRVGGIMVFDDYLWSVDEQGRQDILAMPKPAVDAFANLFMRKIAVIKGGTRDQLFMRKHSD